MSEFGFEFDRLLLIALVDRPAAPNEVFSSVSKDGNTGGLSHDQVQNPVLDVDLLPDLLSIQVTDNGRILRCRFDDGLLWGLRLHDDRAAEFAIDLDRNGNGIKLSVRLIPDRPFLGKDGRLMPRALPEFLGEMRRERSDQNQERLDRFLVRSLVH